MSIYIYIRLHAAPVPQHRLLTTKADDFALKLLRARPQRLPALLQRGDAFALLGAGALAPLPHLGRQCLPHLFFFAWVNVQTFVCAYTYVSRTSDACVARRSSSTSL